MLFIGSHFVQFVLSLPSGYFLFAFCFEISILQLLKYYHVLISQKTVHSDVTKLAFPKKKLPETENRGKRKRLHSLGQ